MERIESIRQLAKLLDRSPEAVRKYLNRTDWPFKRGPWKQSRLPEILAWVRDNVQADLNELAGTTGAASDPNSPVAIVGKLKALKLQREIDMLNIDLAERGGKLHSVADCERRHLQQLAIFKNTLLGLERTIPHAAGLSGDLATKVQTEIRTQVEAALNQLASSKAAS